MLEEVLAFAVVVVGVVSTGVPTSSIAHGDAARLHNLTLQLLKGHQDGLVGVSPNGLGFMVELLGGINYQAVRPGRGNLILHLYLLVPCKKGRQCIWCCGKWKKLSSSS